MRALAAAGVGVGLMRDDLAHQARAAGDQAIQVVLGMLADLWNIEALGAVSSAAASREPPP